MGRKRRLWSERLELRRVMAADAAIATPFDQADDAAIGFVSQDAYDSHDCFANEAGLTDSALAIEDASTLVASASTWNATSTRSWQQRDQVGWYDTTDRFSLQLTESSRLQLDVSGQRVPVKLSIRDAQGRTVASVQASDRTGSVWEGDLSAGNYTLVVNAVYWTPTSYWLTATATSLVNSTPSYPTPATPTPKPTPAQPTTPSTPTTPKTPTSPSAPSTFPDVTDYGGSQDWNVNAVRAPEAWAQGYYGQGVIVAVLDTGVDRSHTDLLGSVWQNSDEVAGDGRDNDGNGYVDDVYGWNFADGNANTFDTNGHGTHVSGTIAAARNGVGATGIAYEADIMPVKVLGADGSGSDYGVAQGIRYAVDNGADIINLSLGSSSYSSTLVSAFDYAAKHDVLIVAASGNEGAASPSYPARFSSRYDNVLSVGAHDRYNATPSFSNQEGNSGAVQVGAPGVGIYSTIPGNRYASWNGTSMATPHVAGLAALMVSANPQLTSAELRDLLTGGANRSLTGTSGVQGVNAATSVAQASAAATSRTASVRTSVSDATASSSRALYRTTSDAWLSQLAAAMHSQDARRKLNPAAVDWLSANT